PHGPQIGQDGFQDGFVARVAETVVTRNDDFQCDRILVPPALSRSRFRQIAATAPAAAATMAPRSSPYAVRTALTHSATWAWENVLTTDTGATTPATAKGQPRDRRPRAKQASPSSSAG